MHHSRYGNSSLLQLHYWSPSPVRLAIYRHAGAHTQIQCTVKRLYFAGRIFREFCESLFIREIIFQRKLFHRHVISILTYFARPVHKTTMYKYFKKVPNTLPNPNGSLSDSTRWKPFLQLIVKCRDWFAKTTNTCTTRGRYGISSATKSLSSSIASQSLSRR